jgi:hypothetical protein
VGGEFDSQTGIAIVTRHPDRSIQNHHLLHEVTHGLLSSGTLFEHNGTVISSGNGLYDAVFANGERPDQELLETLRQINEGIVDTFALTESDLDTPSYLSGAIGGGYSNNINIIKGLSETQPQLLHDVLQTAFVSGVQSTEQATFYANAYRSQPIQ